MKTLLKILFGAIFVYMVVMTIKTSIQISLSEAWPSYRANPWAMATLYDAYFGFITFFVWVAYRETKLWVKGLWFVLIMGLGNIAMSLYVLIQLFRLQPAEPASAILLKKAEQ
jgi:hypothetical protein